ncbi:hypothetical protein LIER_23237 [Lithospermum erythrorhizon]|uniref:Uncharacterized protein n=1 Tax=Lithospermum erythrorhizon TaxID=34254 RepID=A0AAV3QZX8_LITER
MNRTIFKQIKKNIVQSGVKGSTWVDGLPIVTGETPFSLEQAIPSKPTCHETVFAIHPRCKNKLNPKCEGPYRVSRILGQGTYTLEEMNGKPVRRTWHTSNLHKYYV